LPICSIRSTCLSNMAHTLFTSMGLFQFGHVRGLNSPITLQRLLSTSTHNMVEVELKKSPLLQTYEHWFRIIQHRFYNKELEAIVADMPNDTNEVRIQKKREASINSSAALHSAQWRARCQRKGSRWVRLK